VSIIALNNLKGKPNKPVNFLIIYKNLAIKNRARPRALKTAEIIQKRIVTLVSGQPIASKWW